MAVRFHNRGDAADLAEQLIAILESPELQREMAEHNFRAGVEMTMTSVVNNYLRWFELHKCKQAIKKGRNLTGSGRAVLGALRATEAPNWNLQAALLTQRKDGMDELRGSAPAASYRHADDIADRFAWSWSRARGGRKRAEQEERNPAANAKP
jgi:hypothetical protein